MDTKNTIFRFGRFDTGTPVVSEFFGSNPWINFGANNDFPQELIRLYHNSSPIHTDLINRKAAMIAGNGFDIQNDFTLNNYYIDDLNMIVKKAAFDKVLFGGFYLNVTWSKDRKSIARVQHIPYEKVRVAKCDQDKGDMPGFYISKDWLRWRRKENTPQFIAEFNPMIARKNPSQIMFFKTYTPGMEYYALPAYNSALNYIKLDYEISTYHLKNVQNGLMPGMIIVNKSGIPTAEERAEIYNETKASMSGAENAGDFIMVYAETPEKAPEFIPVQLNSSDQRFKDLIEQIKDTVKLAHSFTSAIAGIETSGKLGTSVEITEQLQYMQSVVISPIQQEIEYAFNKIGKINGSDDTLTLKKFVIYDSNALAPVDSTKLWKITPIKTQD